MKETGYLIIFIEALIPQNASYSLRVCYIGLTAFAVLPFMLCCRIFKCLIKSFRAGHFLPPSLPHIF